MLGRKNVILKHWVLTLRTENVQIRFFFFSQIYFLISPCSVTNKSMSVAVLGILLVIQKHQFVSETTNSANWAELLTVTLEDVNTDT